MNRKVFMRCGMLAVMFMLIVGSGYPSFGQKNKKKSKKMSEEEIFQSDFYFIEGEKFYLIEDFAKSLDMFTRALEINGKNAAAHYKIAEIYIQSEKFIEALPHALKAKEIDPENKYYYLLNAKLSLQIGDYINAAKNFEELFAKFKGNDDYLYDLANIYELIKEPQKAIDVYDKLENIHGKYIQITRQKEKMYLQQKDEKSAENEWVDLVDKIPVSENYIGYISFLKDQNKEDKIESILKEAITNNPEENGLVLLYAQRILDKGEIEQSISFMEKPFIDKSIKLEDKINTIILLREKSSEINQYQKKIIELTFLLESNYETDYRPSAMLGDLYYQVGEKEKAIISYEKALDKDDARFEVWQSLIVIETEVQNYDKVLKHVEDARIVFPNQALLYLYGGTAYLMKKDFGNAIKQFERGSRYARRNEDLQVAFLGQLGDAYNGAGDAEKSNGAFDKALEINKDDNYVLNNYSYFLSLRGESLDKALKMSSLLVENNPENPSYLDTHGWVLYKSNKLKDAKKVLEKAITINTSNGIIYEHYGDVLFKLGRKEEAVVQWRKAKAVGKASELIDKKIADRKLYE